MTLLIGIDPGVSISCGIVVFNVEDKSLRHYNYSQLSFTSIENWIDSILSQNNDQERRIYIEDCETGYNTKSNFCNSTLDALVKVLLQKYPGSKLVKKRDWKKLFNNLHDFKKNPEPQFVDIISKIYLDFYVETNDWSEHERSALCVLIQGKCEYYEIEIRTL